MYLLFFRYEQLSLGQQVHFHYLTFPFYLFFNHMNNYVEKNANNYYRKILDIYIDYKIIPLLF